MGCASYEGTNSLPAFVGRVLPEGTTRHADYRRLRERMLETLVQACQKTGWQVHAYCLIRKRFRLVVEGLKRMRWSEADLRARRKGERGKIQLARELRSKTTLPLAWIAARLNTGSRGHLAWLLQQGGSGRLAAPTDQCLLGI